MLPSGLLLWVVILLPFVLLTYSIFLAIENRKPTYKALVPRTLISGVAGVLLLGFVFYYPIRANSAGSPAPSVSSIPSTGNYSDPVQGATLALRDFAPSSEPGWVSFGTGTMVLHSSRNVVDNITAGYRIISFQAAGLIDYKNNSGGSGGWWSTLFGKKGSGDLVLEFKVMPESNKRINPPAVRNGRQGARPANPYTWNTNQILRLRVTVKDNELVIMPLNGDMSDPSKVYHFVRS